MACPSSDSLIRFVYQEAAPNEVKEIFQHIEGCTKCRDEVTSIKALDEGLSKVINAEAGPEPPGQGCPDAMLLATYVDQNLSFEERQRVEAHLGQCASCVDELIAAGQHSQTASAGYQVTPSHLIDQAVRLGAVSKQSERASQGGIAEQILERVRQWIDPLLSQRYWALAGATTCAVIALVFAQQIYHAKPEPELQMRSRGGASRASEEVIAESKLVLSRELKAALAAYSAKPAAGLQSALLALLKEAAPQIPTDQVSSVEIEQSLAEKLSSDREVPAQIRVRLYKDGLLVISEES